VKLSLFHELTTQDPDIPGAVKQRFDEALEQIRYADELGFDTVWAVEHHFLPGYSHLSCPEQFLAAAAMLTKRIRLGPRSCICRSKSIIRFVWQSMLAP
jgi:alkanesulfonate monooxygenase SsuD/methylene tetrahydromethanopterin reductase-like flavin-dependent oxidoreductase (luciferase family)